MIQIQPLQTSILKADKREAEKVTTGLLALTYPNSDKKICRRKETETGWQVLVPMQAEDGTKKLSPVFEYVNDNGRKLIRWDSRLVTIN